MDPTGYYIQPGPLQIKTPYYGIRWNDKISFMGTTSLGLQILIYAIGGWAWINIHKSWLERRI